MKFVLASHRPPTAACHAPEQGFSTNRKTGSYGYTPPDSAQQPSAFVKPAHGARQPISSRWPYVGCQAPLPMIPSAMGMRWSPAQPALRPWLRQCVTHTGGLKIRAGDVGTDEVKPNVPASAPGKADDSGALNQLLGIKGATTETNKWKIRLQLTKPVTWPPLIWGVVCGAAASGNFEWTFEDVAKSIVCMIMSGPCLTGYTQTINDWYDREIDAINEPYRPIPSGAISETEVIIQIWVLLLAGLGLAYGLDLWAGHTFPSILVTALGGSFLSYIYSAPPLKLKQNGWIGNFALGSSYICLPWWAGQLLFGTLPPDVMVLTVLYSIAGLGIAIVNDFKSIEGDRKMGLQSLPVAFGVDTAKWICAGCIDVTQLSVAAYLLATGKLYYGIALLGLICPQIVFQFQYFLKDPLKNDVKYQASAQPFLVLGIFVTALATSH